MENNITAIKEAIKKQNIRFVMLHFVDVLGELKTVEISSTQIDTAFENKIMMDGSSIRGVSAISNADTYLYPDPTSWRVIPFFSKPEYGVASLMCDLHSSPGTPCAGCTRSVLRAALENMKAAGFTTFNVGFEPEFYLLKKEGMVKGKISPAQFLDDGGYCENAINDAAFDIRHEIVIALEQSGIECQTNHHEVGPSQYEINFKFADAIHACDNLLFVRFLIAAVAKKYGYMTTFMPKPIEGYAGNGLHTNVSLATAAGNAFWDKATSAFSETAKSFITGVLTHAQGLCFLTNPSSNSYRRLVKHFEAPVNVCWSYANRSAMVRVPKATGGSARAEVRIVDSSSNPYLAVAGILTAGLDGITNKIPQIAPVDKIIFDLTDMEKKALNIADVPNSLTQSLAAFKADKTLSSIISPKLLADLEKFTK